MNETNASGTNTILIVIVLVAIVALGVWVAAQGGFGGAEPQQDSVNVGIDIPMPENSADGAEGNQ